MREAEEESFLSGISINFVNQYQNMVKIVNKVQQVTTAASYRIGSFLLCLFMLKYFGGKLDDARELLLRNIDKVIEKEKNP